MSLRAHHLGSLLSLSQAEDESNPAPPVEPDHTHLQELAEAPSGMRDSDLRSMKDQLLIETSELLGVCTMWHRIAEAHILYCPRTLKVKLMKCFLCTTRLIVSKNVSMY